ncbi:MAG: class I SAM-dependent methyltransferase, partial [Erythrobacter sp.]|nr:class I SAM-dependent methyltransferase [Erythrobacter sp.]
MTGTSEWAGRVGGKWAQEWRRTDRSFGELTDRLLDSWTIGHFEHALDIGCGAGEIALALAAHDSDASVTGVDISADLLAVARQRGAACDNLLFHQADASKWQPRGVAPDLLISRHGVMFFDDPTAAFHHLRTIATPNARLRFSCFRERAANEWVTLLQSALPSPPSPPDPKAPGPFAFGDQDRIRSILDNAGWSGIFIEPLDYAMIAGEGNAAVEEALAYFLQIGPAAGALADLFGAERERAVAALRSMLERHHTGERVALPAAAWIVTARA